MWTHKNPRQNLGTEPVSLLRHRARAPSVNTTLVGKSIRLLSGRSWGHTPDRNNNQGHKITGKITLAVMLIICLSTDIKQLVLYPSPVDVTCEGDVKEPTKLIKKRKRSRYCGLSYHTFGLGWLETWQSADQLSPEVPVGHENLLESLILTILKSNEINLFVSSNQPSSDAKLKGYKASLMK